MSGVTYLLLGCALGGMLGVVLGWLLGRRNTSPDERLENELRQQLLRRASEMAQLRSELTETANYRVVAEAARKAAEMLRNEQMDLREISLRNAKESQENLLEVLPLPCWPLHPRFQST